MSRPIAPLPELPSDRFQVGECAVVASLREIHAPGVRRPVRVTPKAMGVLRVLVESADKVVSREALLARVWPDTLPTDDVLTQAVTQLRKAFGETRGQARYIETIAKTGYRLLAPVAWEVDDGARAHPFADEEIAAGSFAFDGDLDAAGTAVDAMADERHAVAGAVAPAESPGTTPRDRPRTRTHRRMATLAVGAALFVVATLATFLLLRDVDGRDAQTRTAARSDVPSSPPRPYRLITSAPGFELSPTLSPDAAMIAYAATLEGRRGTVVMLQTTDQAVAKPLVLPPEGQSDRLPAWSPNGREIAFQRRRMNGDCEVMVATASGSGERSVTRCDAADEVSFDWTPDGRGLLFGSMRSGGVTHGIRVLDLASGKWRAIDYGATASDLDFAPRYSQDGQWIVFIRNPQFGDLWRIPAAGGTAERLTHHSGEMRGWDWAPDGKSALFGRRVDSESRIFRLDLATLQLSDLGVDDAQAPDVAAGKPVMAFVRRRPAFGVFRIRRDGTGERQPLFESSARDTQPALAPDGRQLVFASDRSGHHHLWWADVERPETLRVIDGVHPESQRIAEWSPDSRHLLVVGTDHDGRFGVHEVNAANGQLRLLPVPVEEPTQAVYLPDPRYLLVGASERGAARPSMILFDRSQRPWRRVAAIEGVSLAKVDPVGRRVLFTRFSGAGLWSADLMLSAASIRQVDATAPSRTRYRTWTVAGDGAVEYLEQTPECWASLRRIGVAGAPAPHCLQPDMLSSTTGWSSDARAGVVYVALAESDGTDIGIMPLEATAE